MPCCAEQPFSGALHPDLTVAAAGHLLGTEAPRDDAPDQDGSRVAWFFTVELIRSLGLMADSLRRGDESRLARAMDKLRALDAMATRAFSEDAALVVSLIRQVAEGYAESTIYMQVRALSELNPAKSAKLLSYAREQYSRGRGVLWTSQIQRPPATAYPIRHSRCARPRAPAKPLSRTSPWSKSSSSGNVTGTFPRLRSTSYRPRAHRW